jgi:hypothetical protein
MAKNWLNKKAKISYPNWVVVAFLIFFFAYTIHLIVELWPR